jgi:hypothetical protein
MVKFKHDWIGFTTVNTRMGGKVIPDVGAALFHLGLPVLNHVSDVGFFVSCVPVVFLLLLTFSAGPLPYFQSFPAPVKFLYRFVAQATVADLSRQ